MPTRSLLFCLLALAALVAALAATVTVGGTLAHRTPLYTWYALDAALFAISVLLLRRVPGRHVVPLVLAGSAALAAVGMLAPPRTSDDAYRYVWDGRVQAAGISPYAYTPDAAALARLRDPGLFPVTGTCTQWDEHRTTAGDCTRINRPAVHTIYPPVAEAWFLGLHPFGGAVRGVQAAGALLALATTAVLLLVGGGDRRAALWGWCPGVSVWSVNDAHIDTLGALLTAAGLGCTVWHARARRSPERPADGDGRRGDEQPADGRRGDKRPADGRRARQWRRAALGGALLGGAIATKLLPALALPGALSGALSRRPGRRDLVVLAAALGTFAVSYLPYLAASGSGVLGYLPGYLREEGYDESDIQRFGLLRLVLPDHLVPVVAGLLLTAVVLGVLWRGDPARPWRGALLVTGSALLLVAPDYPWYGLLVVVLVALDGRWEWLAVPAAGQVLYLAGGVLEVQQAAYGAALVCVLVGALLRRRLAPPAAGRGRADSTAPGAAGGAADAVSHGSPAAS
ncbi:hypothetical protein ACFZB9_23085 [Kitasatospora sp. NPDC008050]|uniref:hypothetical protein n=1 Tax=Kitasatospora sp. NPDC008050 TaxID=3364021 RepID=UPI0036F1866D